MKFWIKLIVRRKENNEKIKNNSFYRVNIFDGPDAGFGTVYRVETNQ